MHFPLLSTNSNFYSRHISVARCQEKEKASLSWTAAIQTKINNGLAVPLDFIMAADGRGAGQRKPLVSALCWPPSVFIHSVSSSAPLLKVIKDADILFKKSAVSCLEVVDLGSEVIWDSVHSSFWDLFRQRKEQRCVSSPTFSTQYEAFGLAELGKSYLMPRLCLVVNTEREREMLPIHCTSDVAKCQGRLGHFWASAGNGLGLCSLIPSPTKLTNIAPKQMLTC